MAKNQPSRVSRRLSGQLSENMQVIPGMKLGSTAVANDGQDSPRIELWPLVKPRGQGVRQVHGQFGGFLISKEKTMKQRPSRRQWLLGLVGAVFGTSAARALDRILPGKPPSDSTTWLVRIQRFNTGAARETHTKLEGKVEITPGPLEGSYTIAVYGRDGTLIEKSCEALHMVYVYREPSGKELQPIDGRAENRTLTYHGYDSERGLTGMTEGFKEGATCVYGSTYSTYIGGQGSDTNGSGSRGA